MRREEFRIHNFSKAISPEIFQPSYKGKSAQLSKLNSLNDDLPEELVNFVGQFVGDDHGIGMLKGILNHVSVFYNIYLRSVLSDERYHFTTTESGQVVIPAGDDRQGYIPRLGRWSMYLTDQIPIHSELGRDIPHDVPFEIYFEHFKQFVTASGLEAQTLRQAGFGELQSWMFWRYFSNRPLDLGTWSEDFQKIHVGNKRRDGEEEIDHAERVWAKYGGRYFHQFSSLNLSNPRKHLPCAYPLGCVQNLQDIQNANRLSWQHEHSRPESWGGIDGRDSQVMCTHHNHIKSNNFLFDVATLTNIIMIHQLPEFFTEVASLEYELG